MPIVLSPSWEGFAIAAVGRQMPEPKARSWQQTAGRFIFKHRRGRYHLQQISELYERMRHAVKVSIKVNDPTESVASSYSGPLLEELYFHLDGFLEATRSSHDAALSCLSSASVLLTAPSSLHDFYKKHSAHKVGAGSSEEPVKARLLTFWSGTGQFAKSYRDCFSHYVSLSGPTWQHSANATLRQGEWKLRVLLPDNPDARSYKFLEFDKQLDALDVCSRLHADTDTLVVDLLRLCVQHWNAGPVDSGSTTLAVSGVRLGD